MATNEELQARRDALIKQITSLQKRITHGDKSVEFDLSQSRIAMETLDREIMKSKPKGVMRQIRIISDKGL
ncbi:MAG: hypothetical protein HQL95_01765 [Magnetococcales bacterium]|nr:hypothetical protein [Magnetococcales bacterium]